MCIVNTKLVLIIIIDWFGRLYFSIYYFIITGDIFLKIETRKWSRAAGTYTNTKNRRLKYMSKTRMRERLKEDLRKYKRSQFCNKHEENLEEYEVIGIDKDVSKRCVKNRRGEEMNNRVVATGH